MKKEMIISVLVGLTFGLIIVYGVYTARTSLLNPSVSEQLGTSPSPNSELDSNQELIIHSPDDEILVNNPIVSVAGTTLPNAFVVIFINESEIITTADEAGHFNIDGELELGSNIIQVHILKEDGQSLTTERTVIYSTEPLLVDETATTSGEIEKE